MPWATPKAPTSSGSQVPSWWVAVATSTPSATTLRATAVSVPGSDTPARPRAPPASIPPTKAAGVSQATRRLALSAATAPTAIMARRWSGPVRGWARPSPRPCRAWPGWASAGAAGMRNPATMPAETSRARRAENEEGEGRVVMAPFLVPPWPAGERQRSGSGQTGVARHHGGDREAAADRVGRGEGDGRGLVGRVHLHLGRPGLAGTADALAGGVQRGAGHSTGREEDRPALGAVAGGRCPDLGAGAVEHRHPREAGDLTGGAAGVADDDGGVDLAGTGIG